MRLKSARVKNFRCVKDEELDCNNLTALIGPNGSGKSSFLEALDMFFSNRVSYSEDDFYNENVDEPISIKLVFDDLGEQEREEFENYIIDGELSIEKVVEPPDSSADQRYHGIKPVNSDFEEYRSASGRADLSDAYEGLLDDGYDLPDYQNKEEALSDLKDWESANPGKCDPKRDEGKYFSYSKIERYIDFLLIPAVRDAQDDADDGGGVLSELMDHVVRAALADHDEINNLRVQTRNEYTDIIDDTTQNNLQDLEGDLTEAMQKFAPDVGVDLTWDTNNLVQFDQPEAKVKLEVDNHSFSVENAGHGSQRAFIISLLQNLAIQTVDKSAENEDDDEKFEPALILGIEEPEIYQHPNRQRHLMDILSSFEGSLIPGTKGGVQVVYSTHSPLMLSMKRFDDIRSLIRVPPSSNGPKQTIVHDSSMSGVASELESVVRVSEVTEESTKARLEPVMTPWVNEGFFSDVVLLVEGPEDRAALLGRASARDCKLETQGIAVLPCTGKSNIGLPALVFQSLGKDVYIVFDADKGNEESDDVRLNKTLQNIADESSEEIEDYPTGVYEEYACFETNLTKEIRDGFGEEVYDEALERVSEQHGFGQPSKARKNSVVMSGVFESVDEETSAVEKLDKIIDQVLSKSS